MVMLLFDYKDIDNQSDSPSEAVANIQEE